VDITCGRCGTTVYCEFPNLRTKQYHGLILITEIDSANKIEYFEKTESKISKCCRSTKITKEQH